MVDIFAKEGIKVTPKAPGRVDTMALARDLPKVDGVNLQDPSSASRRDVSALPAPMPAASLPDVSGPIDIFSAEDIKAPSITERNMDALNGHINLEKPQGPLEEQVKVEADQNKQEFETLAQSRFTPDQIAGFKANPITFFEADDYLRPQDVLPGGGLKTAIDTFDVLATAEKVKNGETLTDTEVDQMNKYIDRELEMRLRGFSIGGGIAYYGSQMPAFMAEFALTGGAGKAAQVAATKAAQKVATKAIITKTAGVAANVVARTAVMPQMYIPKYAERRLNDFSAITDKGELLFRDSKESPAVSAMKAFGYTSAEVASELSGAAIGRYVLDPVTKTLKTPLIAAVNRVPSATREALYAAYKQIQPNARVSKVFQAGGWNGMLEELGEERVADVLRASLDMATDDEYTFKDFVNNVVPSSDQLMIEAGIISIAGGVKTSGNIALNIMQSKGLSPQQAQEAVDNISAIDQENFVAESLPMPQSKYPSGREVSFYNGRDLEVSFGEDKILLRKYGYTEQQLAQMTDKQARDNFNIVQILRKEAAYRQTSGSTDPNYRFDLEDVQKEIAKDVVEGRFIKPEGTGLFDNLHGESGVINRSHMQETIAELKDWASVEGLTIDQLVSAVQAEIDDGKVVNEKGQYLKDVIGYLNRERTIDETPLSVEDGGEIEPVMAEGEIAAGQVDAIEKNDPPPIDDNESGFNKFYREWINELDPIQTLSARAEARGAKIEPGKNTKLLSATYAGALGAIRQNLQVDTFIKDEFGNNVRTGKALKSTLDDFDNLFAPYEPSRDVREVDFNDYLVAQRYLKDLKDRDDVDVTAEQLAKSAADMTRLAQKYGEEFRFFETFAQEIYDFQRRILSNLVSSGILSQEKYDGIVKKNPNYVPFQRVIDEDITEVISTNPIFTDARASKAIKRIKGSDKDVKNVFHGIIRNTAKIIDLAARNDVAKSIASLASYLPENIQEVSPIIVKKGTAQIQVSYDPKLRAKLQKAIEYFGDTFEQVEKLKVKGFRGVLGSYSDLEKTVRLKTGSNEGTLAHEVGHMLDYKLGLKEKMLSNPEIKEELKALADDRLASDIDLSYGDEGLLFQENKQKVGSKKYLEYIKNDREILANFFDAYVNSNEQVRETAPKATVAFEKIIDANSNLAFIKQIKPSTSRAQETITKQAYGESDQAPADTITVFENGERKYYRVSKPILTAVKQLNPAKLGILETLFSVPASVLRAGATLVPEFWVRNVLRDQQTALLQSGVSPTPVNFVRGLFAVISKNDLYDDWEKSGGSFNSYMEMNDKGLERAYQELFRPDGKLISYLKNPLRIAEDISGGLEQATRIGVFDKAKSRGYSDIEASFISRDGTLDFSRRGSIGKRVNRIIPFFNAGLQGTDKMVRAFKKNPRALTVWAVGTITIPSMFIAGYYLYGAPDDERQEYLEIPQWQKDMFWVVKIDGEWKRYPKPFTYGYIFGSLPERIMNWMYDGDKPEGEAVWKDLVMGIGGAVVPVNDWSALIPPLMKMAIEDITNYNFFTGRNIYPAWMDKLEPEERSNKYTSETAKFIGKQVGVSPAIIDNSVRGVLASSGEYVMDAGDTIIEKVREWNGEKIPEKPLTASDVALIKAFAVRRPAGYRSNSAANFFKNWTEVQQKHATLSQYDGEEKKNYKEKNADILRLYKPMNRFWKQMKGQQKKVDAIYDDPNMSAREKVEMINTLEDNITKIAREANIYYSNARGKK